MLFKLHSEPTFSSCSSLNLAASGNVAVGRHAPLSVDVKLKSLDTFRGANVCAVFLLALVQWLLTFLHILPFYRTRLPDLPTIHSVELIY